MVLGGITLFFIVAGGTAVNTVAPDDVSFGEAMWAAWVYLVDTAAHAGTPPTSERVIAFIITVGGMFVLALLVSILMENMQELMHHLQSGHGKMVLRNHTVVLNWSDKVLPLVIELAEANSSDGGGTIVILAERDKSEMKDELVMLFGGPKRYKELLKGSELIFREGAPFVMAELEFVAVRTARAIVVLADTINQDAMKADKEAIRIVLCLRAMGVFGDVKAMSPAKSKLEARLHTKGLSDPELSPTRRWPSRDVTGEDGEATSPHVVVELCDVDDRPLLKTLAPFNVEAVVTHDFIGRLQIKSAEQRGLSHVFMSLFTFTGAEFYIKEWPQLVNLDFRTIPFLFEEAVVLGLHTKQGQTILCPDLDVRYEEGDSLIVLAEDDDAYKPRVDDSGNLEPAISWVRGERLSFLRNVQPSPLRILMCGWRRDLGDMIEELDYGSPPGSEVTLLADVPAEEREEHLGEGGRDIHTRLTNIRLLHEVGDTSTRSVLERLPVEKYGAVVVVCDELREQDAITSDGRTITTCLLLKEILSDRLASL
jgi:hypothetical protein